MQTFDLYIKKCRFLAQQDKKRSEKRKIEKIEHESQSKSGVPAVGAVFRWRRKYLMV
jgi:hypothetical protein